MAEFYAVQKRQNIIGQATDTRSDSKGTDSFQRNDDDNEGEEDDT